MKSSDTAESILTLYSYKLPFPVAEYFCFTFRKLIVCNKSLNYKLFKEFIEYKENIKYCFGKVVGNDEYTFIKLDGVDILIPIGEEEIFMDKYSNWEFTSADEVGLEWYDTDDDQTNESSLNYDKLKYAGKCKLTF